MAENYYDRIAGIYDASRYLTPEVAGLAAAFFVSEAKLSRSSTIMEVGIGTAANMLPLAPIGMTIVGTDQSRGMLEQARHQLSLAGANLTLHESDSLPLPIDDASIDAVLTVHVIHLFEDWRSLIDDIARVLKSGGVYFYGEYLLPPHRQEFDNLFRTALADLSPPRPTRTQRPPMPTMADIHAELDRRGEQPQTGTIATWAVTETVGQLLGWYAARAFGSCWGMPDPLFEATIQLLRTRLLDRFGTLDHVLQ